jgi:hypothetical protein
LQSVLVRATFILGIVVLVVGVSYVYWSYTGFAAPNAAIPGSAADRTSEPETVSDGSAFDVSALEPSETVFIHRATSESIAENSTYLENRLINANPEAILFVTQNWNPGGESSTYNEHPIGVWYDSGRQRWAIFNQDRAAMPEGAAFNVLVAVRDSVAMR